MTDWAVATVVVTPDPEATYALVLDAQHATLLQQQYRIYGSSEGLMTPASAVSQRLRLTLEEMAVGISKGFLRLEAATTRSDGGSLKDEEGLALVEEIKHELVEGARLGEVSVDAKWRLSPRRHDRLQVFRDLWDKGYIVTLGSKFGADFLIYKDDPKHAHAVALIVVKGYEEPFSRVNIVSFCRVAKMVKKQLIFACVRADGECKSGGERINTNGDSKTEEAADSVVFISLTHALLVSRQESG
ncbi:tRNA intron endonuclease catalytic C-terminal domain [Phytophthora infestans]|uniref:tRNA-intron lyase n=1 Tax=Phytophthora infestans TaxID=4787 RepID=A0A833SLN2_PHYIN|nr:tRNA intron endonuclease catalytic C-terminal domain [Phytophthora infestans]KAF4127951.1 tRNA intron endonuclease catalytic C-terminal domain [Phytophthora infestans]